MPTIFEVDGFKLKILAPPREHGPPHTAVVKRDAVVEIWLGPAPAHCSIKKVDRMARNDVRKAMRLVKAHHTRLLVAWRRIHGKG